MAETKYGPGVVHQKEHDRKKKELQRSKEKLGGRFRSGLRLNLDALSASNRNRQIDAAMDAADNASFLAQTEPTPEQKVSTQYILLSNPVRAMSQSESFMHNAASVDQAVAEKRGKADPDFREKPAHEIRSEARKIYFSEQNIDVLYGSDNLTSSRVSEEDKAFMLDQLPEMFKLLASEKPADIMDSTGEKPIHVYPEGETLKARIVDHIRKALPKLSPDLQERALVALASVDDSTYADRLLRETNASQWNRLDEEAQEKFFENLEPDLDNVKSLVSVLKSNPKPAAHVAIAKFLHRASQKDYWSDPGDRYYANGEGHGQSKWSDVKDRQQQREIDTIVADLTELLSKGVDRSINQLVADTIFNLSKKSRDTSEYGIQKQFYDNSSSFSEFSSSQKPESYDPDLVGTLVSTLEGKLGDYREQSEAIRLAEGLFLAVLEHFKDLLKDKKIDLDDLSRDIKLLKRMIRKFGAEKSGFMSKFQLGVQLTNQLRSQKYRAKLPKYNPRSFLVSRDIQSLIQLDDDVKNDRRKRRI